MNLSKKLAAVLGAGALLIALGGAAMAASGPSVTPTAHSGNITTSGTFAASCGEGQDVVGSSSLADSAGDFTVGDVTVHVQIQPGNQYLNFTVDGGVVMVMYVKGGDNYNEYNYSPNGTTGDGNLRAPNNGGNQIPVISHWVACVLPGDETAPPSFFDTFEAATTQPATDALGTSNKTSGPADASWLLVVGLGVLLASAVVLTPSRVRNRR